MVKYIFSLPILKGRFGKLILALLEFDLTYQLAKVIKGQVMADLVVGDSHEGHLNNQGKPA
jgi:hypothetical protein